MNTERFPVAIIGSGNIGTDLMIKILRSAGPLTMAAMIGIDPESDGLARAKRLGVPTSSQGIDGLLAMPDFDDIRLVFDATSAGAHAKHWEVLRHTGVRVLDLTPAAIGPFCVPVVNLEDHIDAPNLNMVTCGGQATVPIVAAVNQSAFVSYAEIVSSISSKSAGPGTRANIDEFIETTATALKVVGGAQTKQSGHHPQPGRSADSHAQHGVLPRRGRLRSRGHRRVHHRHGRTKCSATCPDTSSSSPFSSSRSTPTTRCTYPRPGNSSAPGSPRCCR